MTKTRRETINARLHELAKANGGGLTAEVVIADAKDPQSPLHDSFEWNVEAAAHRDWVVTASRIINAYRVDVTYESVTLSAPVFIRSPEQPKRYVAVDAVAANREQALAALHREMARVQAAIGRMRSVAAALGLEAPVSELERAAAAVVAR